MKTRKGELSVKVTPVHVAREGAAAAAREVARPDRRRHPVPPALRRPHRERRRAPRVRDPLRGDRHDPARPGRARLRRGRDAGPAHRGRRCGGAAVRDAPQRARHAARAAHRARAAPQAPARRRARAGVRDRAGVPQRGLSDSPQPRVHDARAVPGLCRLHRHDDAHRGARRRVRTRRDRDDGRRGRRREST